MNSNAFKSLLGELSTRTYWNESHPSVLTKCKWLTLSSTRRKVQKLKMCYNILNNLSIISPSLFTFHSSCTLPYHSRILFMSLTRTNSHRFSFFVDTIPYWKSLPSSIVGLLLKKVNFHKNSYNLCGA